MSEPMEDSTKIDIASTATVEGSGLYEKLLELRKKMEEEGIPFLNDEELEAEILSRKTGRW